jgi:intracellular septation protein
METVRGPAWVKYVVDYAGLLAFAGAYFVTRDLLQASWGLAVGSAIGLATGLLVQKKLALLPLITGLFAVVFAGLALIFHNTAFIKMKMTIVDVLLAAALLGGLAMKKQPLKALLGEALKLTDETWRKLTVRFGAFFILLAVLNLLVWWASDHGILTDGQFVLFRFPVVPILTVLFSFTQMPLMMKDMMAQQEGEVLPPVPPAD